MDKRLAIITTHPIQYNAPLFRLLHQRAKVVVKVFYTWGPQVLENKYDPGFEKNIQWDIPLLDGYNFIFVSNVAERPGSHHFKGIDNPTLNLEISDWKADAILVYGWNYKSHLKAIRNFHNKIPVYFRGDSTLLDNQSLIKKIFKKIGLTWVYRFVDKAIYVGQNNKYYFKNYGIRERDLVWAPHSIENERFKANEENKKWAEDKKLNLGIRKESIVLLFAGKLEHKKNPELLLSVFSELKNPDLILIIVGNGPLETKLKQQYKLHANIRFIDFQNQSIMPSIYQLADIFILSSKGPNETWGLSINEAMAGGKAVLVSNKCGAAIDLVKDGVNGYIFNSEDRNDLKNKLEFLVSNKPYLNAMGTQSQEIIKGWNYEKVCLVLEDLLNKQSN